MGIGNDDHASDTLSAIILDGRWVAAVLAFVASVHMFASVCLNSSKQIGFLNGRTFQFLGTISYSLYLWHVLVIAVTKRIAIQYFTPVYGEGWSFVLFALVSLAIAIPLSWLSWKLFESMLARRLRNALRRPRVVATAVSVS